MLGFSDGFLTRRKREGNFFPITRVIEESLESWRLFKTESELGIEEWYWPLQRRIITRKCLKVGGSFICIWIAGEFFYSIQLIFFHPPYRDTSARQSCPLLSIIPDPVACLPPRGCAPKLSLPFKPTSTLWKKGKWSFGAPWSGKISVLPSNEPRNPDGDDDDASGRWNAKVRLDTENRCKERVSLNERFPISTKIFTLFEQIISREIRRHAHNFSSNTLSFPRRGESEVNWSFLFLFPFLFILNRKCSRTYEIAFGESDLAKTKDPLLRQTFLKVSL